MKKLLLFFLSVLFVAPLFSLAQSPFTSTMLGEMKVRQIGSATMSGRITAMDALQSDANIVYIGAANGGVWKSTNGATSFKPVFDKHRQSVGAITIDQQRPDTVWVGTGEIWTRNSVSVGDGIYKTYDGGDTWQHMGLEDSERIAKIIIHPEDPQVIYVAVLGALWSDSESRGVYKTTDGGASWEKILYVDARTGASDLILDSQNPNRLIAGMYAFRRTAWDYFSGGEGSGLYESLDGGNTWSRMSKDLPQGMLGRISLSQSPADPLVMYALIESDSTALFRSIDGGASWTEKNRSGVVGERPFYFNLIVADPVDTARVWKPGLNLNLSKDGGKSFSVPYNANPMGGGIHVDHHALWINPKDNRHVYLGTDGGLYISRDGAQTWSFSRSLPISQFYHVSVDRQRPYHVYGGLQDNGSWMAPSRGVGGIRVSDWKNLGGGDGFYVFPDAEDENIAYWQSQGGNVVRFYQKTRESKSIKPTRGKDEDKLRFNWDTPVHFGKAGGAMYIGAQYLYKSLDKGDTWVRISPDLTTNDPEKQKQAESGGLTRENTSAENHTTIYAIEESPLDEQVVWVGTDDGNLQVTLDGGENWENVVSKLPGLPANNWVSYVEASHHAPGRAFAVFDGHRSGDMNSYVYRTEDFGQTWMRLESEQLQGYAHVITEDPVNSNLLFLGTEFGLFLSLDRGASWFKFENMPPVAVMDMVIHPVENDLVMATHGRGIFILDDITALRGISPEILEREISTLPSRDFRIGSFGGQQIFPGDDEYVGPNPSEEATISYYLKKRHIFGDLKVLVLDENDQVIADIPAGKAKGINRVTWSARMKAPKVPSSRGSISANALFGPNYPPGTYKVRIIKGEEQAEGSITLSLDPASPHSVEDRTLQFQTSMKAYNLLEELGYQSARLVHLKSQSDTLSSAAKGRLKKDLQNLSNELSNINKRIVSTDGGMFSEDGQLRGRVSEIYGGVSRFQGKPSQSQLDGLALLEAEIRELGLNVTSLLEKAAVMNAALEKAGLKAFTMLSREEFETQD